MKAPKAVSLGIGGGSGPGGVGGASVSSADATASIAVSNNAAGDTNIKLTTDEKVALVVDHNQNVVIGTETIVNPAYRLTILAPDGQCLSMINQTTRTSASATISPNGVLAIDTTGSSIQFGTNKIYIGSNLLYLGSSQVLSSATELNYVSSVVPGTAQSAKALVVDANRNLANLNAVSADTFSGTLLTEYQPNITSLTDVNVTSLSLNGAQILSTSSEINLLHGVTAGIARPERVVIVDSERSVRDLNSLTAKTLTGELTTAIQPNITTVGTLASLKVVSAIGIGNVVNSPQATLDIVNPAPTIRLANSKASAVFSITGSGNLQIHADNDITIASTTNLKFGGESTITGLAGVTASTLTGTIQTSNQPSITSVGELTTLAIKGDLSIGTGLVNTSSNRLIIKEPSGQCVQLVRSDSLACTIAVGSTGDLELSPTRDLRLASGKSIRMNGSLSGVTDLTATTVTGELQTSAQPKITAIGTLESLKVSSAIVAGTLSASTFEGTLLTSAQPNITSIGILTDLTVSNRILTSVVAATKLSGELQSEAQPKITSIGTLTSLTVAEAITARSVSAPSLTGTLLTAAQPNINAVGTLHSLTVGGSLSASSVTAETLSGQLGGPQPDITAVGTLQSLNVAKNVNAGSIIASTLTGQLQTGSQTNITSVGTLSSLTVAGAATAASVTAATLAGTLTTGPQPQITSVGTLTRVLSSGPIGIGTNSPTCALDIYASALPAAIRVSDGYNTAQLSVGSDGCTIDTGGSTLTLASRTNLRFVGGTIIDLASLSANTLSGQLTSGPQPNISLVGSLAYLDAGYLGVGGTHSDDYRVNIVNSTGKMLRLSNETDLFYVQMIKGDYTISTTNDRVALGPNVDLVLNSGTILGLSTLTATSLAGRLTTPAQPNITSVGVLDSLTCAGPISAGNADFGALHLSGDLIIDGTIKLSTPILQPSISTSMATFDATVDATSVSDGGTLTVLGGGAFGKSLFVGGDLRLPTGNVYFGTTAITPQTALALTGTPGLAAARTFLSPDASGDLSGFRRLSAATVSATDVEGTIQTPYQPKISSLGELSALNVVGNVGVGTSSPGKQLEVNSATGNCLRLRCNKEANPRAYLDLSVDSNGNSLISSAGGVTTVDGRLVSPQIILGDTTNSQIPLEIGYSLFTMTQPFAYNTAANGHGTAPANAAGAVYNYSIRALGRVLCTTSVDVMSDRRMKTNIQELSDEYCADFVAKTTPVSFNWINGDSHTCFGYIAQDLIRAGYSDLVNLAEDLSVKEEVDRDGFVSPEGVKFTVSYEHIIPILAKNQRLLMRQIAKLTATCDTLAHMLAADL